MSIELGFFGLHLAERGGGNLDLHLSTGRDQGRHRQLPGDTGGKLDPLNRRGVVEHDGAHVFRAGRNSAKKLDARGVFRPGMELGRTVTTVNPATIGLARQNKVELLLDSGFQAKLDSLFVAVDPILPAEHPGPFTLPVLGGSLSPGGANGRIDTQGALEFLQLGGGQVLWHEPWFDFTYQGFTPEPELLPSPPFPGKQARTSVGSMSRVIVSAGPESRSIGISGALSLSAVAASAFNEMFATPQGKKDVFSAGDTLGTMTVIAQGQ